MTIQLIDSYLRMNDIISMKAHFVEIYKCKKFGYFSVSLQKI